MSKSRFLVDAGTVIDFFNGRTELFHLFDEYQELALSVVSCGEIYSYARKASDNCVKKDAFTEDAFAISRDFCSQLEQIPITSELCEKFSEFKKTAEEKNILISDNKLWVAATAVYYNLILVSEDSVFDNFMGLNRNGYSSLAI